MPPGGAAPRRYARLGEALGDDLEIEASDEALVRRQPAARLKMPANCGTLERYRAGPHEPMALRNEFVEYMTEKVIEELIERGFIELPEDFSIKETIYAAVSDEVTVEDRLNQEVRQLLNEYGNQMNDIGASYQETFKLIKRKFVRERKLVI